MVPKSAATVDISVDVGKATCGFPSSSDDKESACNTGDPGSIPELGRSPAGGHGNPLRYCCLVNSVDRGAWWVHRVAKSWMQLSTTELSLSKSHKGSPGWGKSLGRPSSPCPALLWLSRDLSSSLLSSPLCSLSWEAGFSAGVESILPLASEASSTFLHSVTFI